MTRPAQMVHIGRRVPKTLAAAGWREMAGAIHLGRGIWILRLVRDGKPSLHVPAAKEPESAA